MPPRASRAAPARRGRPGSSPPARAPPLGPQLPYLGVGHAFWTLPPKQTWDR